MQPKFEEYTQMVGDLAAGGFTAKQSEELVTLLARLFSQQSEFFERIRREDKEEREKLEAKLDAKLDSLEAKLDASIKGKGRWMITTLTALVLSMLGTAIFYSLRIMG